MKHILLAWGSAIVVCVYASLLERVNVLELFVGALMVFGIVLVVSVLVDLMVVDDGSTNSGNVSQEKRRNTRSGGSFWPW